MAARTGIIGHPPEGRTEVVSGYRGNDVACAAKCLVVMVKVGKKVTRYFLAVVSGDARVDLDALKRIVDGFNAGRLDRSLALRTADYLRLARPQVRPIVVGADAADALR